MNTEYDFSANILRQASPAGAMALGLSPYNAVPTPRGAVRMPLRGSSTPAMPSMQPPDPVELQGLVNRLAPGIERIASYLPNRAVQQAGRNVGGLVEPPKIGKQVKPETIIDRIRDIESSGNYQAKNQFSSASGGYQYTDGTWNNYGGYPTARLAPKEIQDRRIQEDIARRVMQFDGDVFRVIAAHYLPRDADNPETWARPARVGKHKVDPVANYVRKVIKGTALEGQFDDYLQQYAQ